MYETEGVANVVVRLSKLSSQDIKVAYTTIDGTATSKKSRLSQKDYTSDNGTLTIKAGFISGTISITVVSDGIVEGDEYFDVTLSKPLNVTIADGNGRVTIKDGVPPSAVQKTVASNYKEVTENAFSVQVLPNPFSSSATLGINGSSAERLTIRVVDAGGRVVESRTNIRANTTIQLGNNYRPGIYYVEVVQGDQRRTIPLIKRP